MKSESQQYPANPWHREQGLESSPKRVFRRECVLAKCKTLFFAKQKTSAVPKKVRCGRRSSPQAASQATLAKISSRVTTWQTTHRAHIRFQISCLQEDLLGCDVKGARPHTTHHQNLNLHKTHTNTHLAHTYRYIYIYMYICIYTGTYKLLHS